MWVLKFLISHNFMCLSVCLGVCVAVLAVFACWCVYVYVLVSVHQGCSLSPKPVWVLSPGDTAHTHPCLPVFP